PGRLREPLPGLRTQLRLEDRRALRSRGGGAVGPCGGIGQDRQDATTGGPFQHGAARSDQGEAARGGAPVGGDQRGSICAQDRKSTRLNSSHVSISYAVFCLKKKKISLPTHS